jgi:hypothetical protein
MRHFRAGVAAAATAVLICGACADGDPTAEHSADAAITDLTTPKQAEGSASASSAPGPVAGASTRFCNAKTAFDAIDNDTPDEAQLRQYVAAAVPAMRAVAEAAPADVVDAAQQVVARLTSLDSLDTATAAHSDAAYNQARATVARAVHERCGYQPLHFEISANAFVSAPVSAHTGRSSVLLTNDDDGDVHALVFARLHEGVTPEQLRQHPESLESNADIVNAVLAGYHATDGIVIDLEPGVYVYFDPEYYQIGLAGPLTVA